MIQTSPDEMLAVLGLQALRIHQLESRVAALEAQVASNAEDEAETP